MKKVEYSSDWTKALDQILPHGMIRGILFSGDRWSCCDEAVLLYEADSLLGIATISPDGEPNDGVPDIVGLYILPPYRCKGYGRQLLAFAIQRCLDRGLPTPIRITSISAPMNRAYEALPDEIKQKTQFIDMSFGIELLD